MIRRHIVRHQGSIQPGVRSIIRRHERRKYVLDAKAQTHYGRSVDADLSVCGRSCTAACVRRHTEVGLTSLSPPLHEYKPWKGRRVAVQPATVQRARHTQLVLQSFIDPRNTLTFWEWTCFLTRSHATSSHCKVVLLAWCVVTSYTCGTALLTGPACPAAEYLISNPISRLCRLKVCRIRSFA